MGISLSGYYHLDFLGPRTALLRAIAPWNSLFVLFGILLYFRAKTSLPTLVSHILYNALKEGSFLTGYHPLGMGSLASGSSCTVLAHWP